MAQTSASGAHTTAKGAQQLARARDRGPGPGPALAQVQAQDPAAPPTVLNQVCGLTWCRAWAAQRRVGVLLTQRGVCVLWRCCSASACTGTCVKLRGLPYGATDDDIRAFLKGCAVSRIILCHNQK